MQIAHLFQLNCQIQSVFCLCGSCRIGKDRHRQQAAGKANKGENAAAENDWVELGCFKGESFSSLWLLGDAGALLLPWGICRNCAPVKWRWGLRRTCLDWLGLWVTHFHIPGTFMPPVHLSHLPITLDKWWVPSVQLSEDTGYERKVMLVRMEWKDGERSLVNHLNHTLTLQWVAYSTIPFLGMVLRMFLCFMDKYFFSKL